MVYGKEFQSFQSVISHISALLSIILKSIIKLQKHLELPSYDDRNTSNAIKSSLKSSSLYFGRNKNKDFDACYKWETAGVQIRAEEKKEKK